MLNHFIGPAAIFAAAWTALAAAGKEPEFDYQLAAPDFVSRQTQAEDQGDRRVTVKFQNATADDIFTWLDTQRLSLVWANRDVAGKVLTLTIHDQPLKDVADAIAQALGGRWVSTGGVRVFTRTGAYGFSPQPGAGFFGGAPSAPRSVPNQPFPNGLTPGGRPLPPGTERLVPALRFEGGAAIPPLPAGTERLVPALRFENGAAIPPLPAGRERLVPALRFENGAAIPPLPPAPLADGLTRFYRTLSSRQRELMKRRGYLRPEELTPNQRRTLGIDEMRGSFDIVLSRRGERVEVKGK